MSQASDSAGTLPPDTDSDASASDPVQPAPAPKPEPKPDGGGELPELSYWPALVVPKGEFTVAHSELEGMKVYAIAFQNAQNSAKKKALEAVDVWVGIKESTKHRSEEATKHAAATQQTVDSAGKSASSAQTSRRRRMMAPRSKRRASRAPTVRSRQSRAPVRSRDGRIRSSASGGTSRPGPRRRRLP